MVCKNFYSQSCSNMIINCQIVPRVVQLSIGKVNRQKVLVSLLAHCLERLSYVISSTQPYRVTSTKSNKNCSRFISTKFCQFFVTFGTRLFVLPMQGLLNNNYCKHHSIVDGCLRHPG